MARLLTFFPFLFISSSVFAWSGFLFFDSESNPLNLKKRTDLLRTLESHGTPSTSQDIYENAFVLTKDLSFHRDYDGAFQIANKSDFKFESIYKAAQSIVKKIPAASLEKIQTLKMEITLFDTFKQARQSWTEDFSAGKKHSTAQIKSLKRRALLWHQDKFGFITEEKGDRHFDFLFFSVLKAGALTPYELQIGKLPYESLRSWNSHSAWIAVDENLVHSVYQMPGETGAGYFIDQNSKDDAGNIFVHSYTEYEPLYDLSQAGAIFPTRMTVVARILLGPPA